MSREGRPEDMASLEGNGFWVLFLPPVPSNFEHSSLSMVRSPYLSQLTYSFHERPFKKKDIVLHNRRFGCAIGHFLVLFETTCELAGT